MRKPQVKMLKTRAKNARKRAAMKTARDVASLSEQATIEKRAKAYGEMENSVCDLSRAAEMAMTVFDMTGFSCSPSVNSTSWCSGSRIGITPRFPATTSATNRPPAWERSAAGSRLG